MYFSRRKLAEPSPPFPAWTSILASSMNFINKKALPVFDRALFWGLDRLRRRSSFYDTHSIVAIGAADGIFHLPVHARVQREVAAHADVGAGVHARAALAHQDLPRV